MVAVVVYVLTTPNTSTMHLTGVVMGTDQIVSPLVSGRLSHLLVDEGTQVKKGQLLAEIDPTELQAIRNAAAANIQTLQARLRQSTTTRTLNDEQTSAGVEQAAAALKVASAQLSRLARQPRSTRPRQKETRAFFPAASLPRRSATSPKLLR